MEISTAEMEMGRETKQNYGGTITWVAAPETIAIDPESISIKVGETKQLTVLFTPAVFINTLTWICSNTGVAKVDPNGEVKAIKAGTATITATCVVTVENNAYIYRQSIALDGLIGVNFYIWYGCRKQEF